MPISSQPISDERLAPLATRGGLGGVLMGLANLVPGISGGTMLLAAGVYPQFITAVAEVTTLRWRPKSIMLLACVVAGALVAILGLAGPVKDLVVHHRWIMYSIFIGLTLGGVPLIWRLIERHCTTMWLGAAAGFAGMVALAILQARGATTADRAGFAFMFLAGAAGASAMILPGVSGGYLLLVLGVYVPLLAAIAAFKDALPVLGTMDSTTLLDVGLSVILPVGLGVLVGIVVVSNLLRWLLLHFEKSTLGFLLGLLLGAVVGLWPFQTGQRPEAGETLKNQRIVATDDGGLVFEATGRPVEAEDWPTSFFRPSAGQTIGALALITAGFGVSTLIARVGAGRPGPA